MPTTTRMPTTPSPKTRLLDGPRVIIVGPDYESMLRKTQAVYDALERFAGRDRRRIKREIRKARQHTK